MAIERDWGHLELPRVHRISVIIIVAVALTTTAQQDSIENLTLLRFVRAQHESYDKARDATILAERKELAAGMLVAWRIILS